MPSIRRLSVVALGMGAAAAPLSARMNAIAPDEPIRVRQGSIASDAARSNSVAESDFDFTARSSPLGSRSPRAASSSTESLVEDVAREVDFVHVPEAAATSSSSSSSSSVASTGTASTVTTSATPTSDAAVSPKKHFRPPQGRKCGTAKPHPALKKHHRTMQLAQRELDAAAEQEALARREAGKPAKQQAAVRKVNVKTYFHVVTTQADQGAVTKKMVANQLGQMQQAYAAAGITFTLAGVDWTVNDGWAADQDSDGMKRSLRRGGYSDLNVYFQSALSADGSGSADQLLLGYCTMPTQITYAPCDGCAQATLPQDMWVGDGCNVHAGSMPGGFLDGYNQGKTAVHESGHWFGLFHTFEGQTCDAASPGDYIDDTPKQAVMTDGCPVGKDSCAGPDCPGIDPIHNFMDYSNDACYTGFTRQQISRMQAMYAQLRKGL